MTRNSFFDNFEWLSVKNKDFFIKPFKRLLKLNSVSKSTYYEIFRVSFFSLKNFQNILSYHLRLLDLGIPSVDFLVSETSHMNI